MQPSNFNNIISELKNYGQKGFEEVSFKSGTPKLQSKPNFLFRIIRYLFRGGYQEKETVLKVVKFLEENKLLIKDTSDIETLKTAFSKKFTNITDKAIVEGKFNTLIQQIKLIATRVVNTEKAKAPEPKILDVPDDGNCLFYAIAVGLGKQYGDYPEIQQKLGWKIDSEQLTHLAANGQKLLEKPAKILRAQAAEYLENHQKELNDVFIEAIASHREASQEQIQRAKETLLILDAELKTAEANFEKAIKDYEEAVDKPQEDGLQQIIFASLLEQVNIMLAELDTAIENIKQTASSIQSDEEEIFKEGDIQGYLELSKQDRFFGGTAQILALSQEYNIPIRVTSPDGAPQIFNEDSPLPVLTIHFVNRNHIQYVDG